MNMSRSLPCTIGQNFFRNPWLRETLLRRRWRSDYAAQHGHPTAQHRIHDKYEATSSHSMAGLHRLPLKILLRNILFGAALYTPLFSVGLGILERIAISKSAILNPDRNPLIRALIKPIIYDHFCAGTKRAEVLQTRDAVKSIGYSGVILCYGREIQISKSNDMHSTGKVSNDQAVEIGYWRDGNLETLDMIGEDDWLGIKLTGAGSGVTNALMTGERPPQIWIDAMDDICKKAAVKNARIWIDSEQQAVQTGIDLWTIDLMRRYNEDRVLVYNTVQAYLKASRDKLKHQLALSHSEGWTLGVKLVRGAYIASDRREKIHDTKQDTDDSYNGIVCDVLAGTNLGFESVKFPKMRLFLAGHNPDTIDLAWNRIQNLLHTNELKVMPEFGQLQGMADEVGCRLLQRCSDLQVRGGQQSSVPRVYKCLTWGSIQECMLFLIRRAVENRTATERLKDAMTSSLEELKRRIFKSTR